MTLRISAPHFVAGVVTEHDQVIKAAPIVKYMRGWDGRRVFLYCAQKGWECMVIG